jgi:hypothetical protein
MIRPVGFLDLSTFTATFVVKYRERMQNGILTLRDIGESGEAEDLPVTKQWRASQILMKRALNEAHRILGKPTALGRMWIETLPGGHGTPWTIEDDDYAQRIARIRVCMIPGVDAYSMSGGDRISLAVGVLNQIEHRVLCSEVNFGTIPRTHLIADVHTDRGEED